jgi:hypothetical protein
MLRRLLVLLVPIAVLCSYVAPAYALKPMVEHTSGAKKAKAAPKKDAKPAHKTRAKKAHAAKNKHA